jgi:hypothetical protein
MLEPNATKVTMLFPILGNNGRPFRRTFGHGGWTTSSRSVRTTNWRRAALGEADRSVIGA